MNPLPSAFEQACQLLGGVALEQVHLIHPTRLDIEIVAPQLILAVEALQTWGYLSAITGLDLGKEAGQLEVLYHFCQGAFIVTLRVKLPHANPQISTITSIIPPADVYERELREMLGIEVLGLPQSDYLFLPDDWEEGCYPLRKDAQLAIGKAHDDK